jgi:hypothetical protein
MGAAHRRERRRVIMKADWDLPEAIAGNRSQKKRGVFGVHLGSNKNFRGLLWAVLVAIRAA